MKRWGMTVLAVAVLVPAAACSDSNEAYESAYSFCSVDPRKVYALADTEDPKEAATWYAARRDAGEARDPTYQGCLDGLLGTPRR